MSLSQVCGFIATIRSTPPRRPSQPASDTRTSYHVGRPWMFDGKILRDVTGTPMRRIDSANSSFALADPEPLTLANLTTKSFVVSIGFGMNALLVRVQEEIFACPKPLSGSARRTGCSAGQGLHPSPSRDPF